MEFFAVYYKGALSKLIVNDTFKSEKEARDNLLNIALDYIRGKEGEDQVKNALQTDKSLDEIKANITLKDGHYLKYDPNDKDILNLYEKFTIVLEGTIWNSYEPKIIEKGYYSIAKIDVDTHKIVNDYFLSEGVNDIVSKVIENKMSSNDYESLASFLDLYSNNTSDELDDNIDDFLINMVTKRIESRENNILAKLFSLLRKYNNNKIEQANEPSSFETVLDNIKQGGFNLKKVEKHPRLVPPVPPRPVGGFKHNEEEYEEEYDEEYDEDMDNSLEELSDMEEAASYDNYYEREMNKYYDTYYENFCNSMTDIRNDLHEDDFVSIEYSEESSEDEFKKALLKQIARQTHSQTQKN